jgi:hypothetical protein
VNAKHLNHFKVPLSPKKATSSARSIAERSRSWAGKQGLLEVIQKVSALISSCPAEPIGL